jgi:predicted esterase
MANLSLIHRFIPATQPGLPTLLLLHGTGGDENDLLDLGGTLLPGAARLSPRGNVLENGMPRFFRRIAPNVFDIEDLKKRTTELAGFVRLAADTYQFDAAKVIAVGYSNGANIAVSLMLLEPDVLTGGILLRAMVPLVPEKQPDLTGKSVLLMEGRFDQYVPVAQAEALANLLRSSGADVTLQWQETGHGLTAGEFDEARDWLAGVTKKL